jgi:predicted nuclease of predicted toxin-antitoxin system
MKLLFDESLSPRLVELLSGLFPESESALRNGLAGSGDVRILWSTPGLADLSW